MAGILLGSAAQQAVGVFPSFRPGRHLFKGVVVSERICKNCKFWSQEDNVDWCYCYNDDVLSLVDSVSVFSFHKDFGCRFWEGEKCQRIFSVKARD